MVIFTKLYSFTLTLQPDFALWGLKILSGDKYTIYDHYSRALMYAFTFHSITPRNLYGLLSNSFKTQN